jgi:transcriptional regulator GlxA family with amidase domain
VKSGKLPSGVNDIIGVKNGKVKIGVLAYEGVMQSALHGIEEILQVAVSRHGVVIDKLVLVSPDTLPSIRFNLLLVPPSLEQQPPVPSPSLLSWLKAQHRSGCVLASACAGIFLLAPTGLLDGRAATTHWLLAEQCKRKFPSIKFQPERLLVDEGDVVTAGGVSAWMDLTLALIGRFFGGATAIALGKYFLMDIGSRKQSYFSCFTPVLDHKDPAVLQVQHKLEKHFAMPLSIAKMAEWVHISPRTLQRRFQTATGESPIRYLQKLRLSKAQERLESSLKPLEEIVVEIGYEDLASFRKLFRRHFGLSPSRYRQRFSFPQKRTLSRGAPK